MPKRIWEAADLKMGRIEIERTETETGEPAIRLTRYYQFADSVGNVLADLSAGGVTLTIAWADIPVDIQSALSKIDNFIYREALKKEGLA